MGTLTRREFLAVGGGAAATTLPLRPSVELMTALGGLTLLLRPDRAPLSANDFLRYVDAHAYDGGRFFRVVRADNDRGHPHIDVVQGGARPGVKQGSPVAHETTAHTGLQHVDGAISLTRDSPGTGSGAEFFICVGDQPGLDFGGTRNPDGQGFAVFGRVASGMDVVRRIWMMDASGKSDDVYTNGQILRAPVAILSARRV
jgi:peptidyl-prolyl cis-trans isomerase A (cyclophilin A)